MTEPDSWEIEVDAVATAWLHHIGYTDEQIEAAAKRTCRDDGCEPYSAAELFGPGCIGTTYDCVGEDGKSTHPDRDHIDLASDMAAVAVEALAKLRPAECPAADPTVPTPTPTPTNPPTAQPATRTMPPALDAPDAEERATDAGPSADELEALPTGSVILTDGAARQKHFAFAGSWVLAGGEIERSSEHVREISQRIQILHIPGQPAPTPRPPTRTRRPGPTATRRAGAHLLACLAPHLDLIHLATTNGIPGGPRSEPALLELLGGYARDAAAAAGWSGDPNECWRCGGNPCECGTPGAPA